MKSSVAIFPEFEGKPTANVPEKGQLVCDLTVGICKIGDGVNCFANLPIAPKDVVEQYWNNLFPELVHPKEFQSAIDHSKTIAGHGVKRRHSTRYTGVRLCSLKGYSTDVIANMILMQLPGYVPDATDWNFIAENFIEGHI